MLNDNLSNALRFFTQPLRPDADKFANGRVLVIAGSRGMTGAAILCAGAAIRSGAGLVYSAIPGACLNALECSLIEAVKCPFGEGTGADKFASEDAEKMIKLSEDVDAAVIGPGLGREETTQKFVLKLLGSVNFAKKAKAVVVDADALYAFAGTQELLKDAAEKRPGRMIITPHEGEAARLLGLTRQQVHENREENAEKLAGLVCGGAAVLKGHRTLIAGEKDGRLIENTTGNPGMGTGGSGDVLAGMIAAFAISAKDALTASAYAAALHGLSGDIMAEKYGERYIAASDLIKGLGELKKYAGQYESMGRN